MNATDVPIYIGWSPDEMRSWNVAQASMRRYAIGWLDIYRVSRYELQARDLYTRVTDVRDGHRWDVVSDAPMSTDHAIARFFVPLLCEYKGWALFMDGDVMLRRDIDELLALADPKYAVMCVQHGTTVIEPSGTKKDGAPQTYYARKNWSSVMLWNCEHRANKSLNLHSLNTLPGRDLHRFAWLADHEIGALPPEWNHLVNIHPRTNEEQALVHFTLGTPDLPNVDWSPFDSEWMEYARFCGYQLSGRA